MKPITFSVFLVLVYSSITGSTIVNKFIQDGDAISTYSPIEYEATTISQLRNGGCGYNFTFCDEKPRFRMGSGSLMTYLMRLLVCEYSEGRPWFRVECAERIYDITDYYTAVYTAFCEADEFNSVCATHRENHTDVYFTRLAKDWLAKQGMPIIKNDSLVEFNVATGQPFLQVECQQVESYYNALTQLSENNSSCNETYEELNNPFYEAPYSEYFIQFRPFCEPVACGVSRTEYNVTPKSSYLCFANSCRSAIVFIMVFDSILAAVVVVANFLVLAVAVRSTIMRNVPGYFKVSLAIADLMIGLFVLPGSVYNNYVLSIAPLPFRVEGQRPVVTDFFNQHYLDFMGIFTVLSFSVSIYTMGGASLDRYLAITKPFRYRQGEFLTKRRAAIVFAAIWSFSLLIALYPIFSSSSYQISALSLILSTGMVAAVVYAVTIGLPLIAVWSINGLMLCQVQKDGKNRRTISVRSKPTFQRKESSPISTPNLENNKENQKSTKESGFSFTKSGRISQLSFHMKRIRNMRSKSNASRKGGHKQENVERKLAKTLAVMVGAFTIALLPSVIILILISALERVTSPQHFPTTYSPTALNALTSIEYFASRLFLSNSFWNCLIYSIRNQQFRRALVGVFIFNKEKRRQFRISFRESSDRRKLSKMSSVESGCTLSSSVDRRSTPRTSSMENIEVDNLQARRNNLSKMHSTDSGCAVKNIRGGNKQILIKAYSTDSGLTVAYKNNMSGVALNENIGQGSLLGSTTKILENV